MRSLLLSSAFFFVLIASTAANVQPNARRSPGGIPVELPTGPPLVIGTTEGDEGGDKYCEWCLKFFGTLKEVISDVNNMTREQLEDGLQLVCKYLEDDCPWMEEFCEDFGPDLIDLLFAYIKEVDAEIQPLHDCKLLFACWGRENDRKLALQRLLVQNRVRLD
ncbi:hypothetical protein M3Y99_01632100 [Aphelenchoides fujianensis]|nr:hypothetical protein M3Y99_01632100 [Aphelenchoides fujianensis]